MNEKYRHLANIFERLSQLSPQRYQLLELLLKQEQQQSDSKSNVVYSYYNSLSNQGAWLDYEERENKYEETFLTFGPFAEIVPGFSWMMAGAYPQKYKHYIPLVLEAQKEMREVLFGEVNFSSCAKVLDFGCGYGSDLIALAQKYSHLELCGYTISNEQARVAHQKIKAHGFEDRIKVFNRDSSQDEFPDQYDLIFGFEVAHHIKNKQALFSNIGKHLSENGLLVLADFISNQAFSIEHDETSSYFITKNEWVENFSENYLQVIDSIDISYEISNFLYDPNFQENIDHIERVKQDDNIRAAFQSYNQLGKLLGKGMASYVLLTAQKQSHLSKNEIYQLNQEKLRQLVPYSEKSVQQGLYQLDWQPLALTKSKSTLAQNQKKTPESWLIFADEGGVAQALAKRIEAQGDRCVLVFSSPAYEQASETSYTINPLNPQDFQRLLTETVNNHQSPYRGVIHLWSLDETAEAEISLNALQNSQVRVCGSVLHLVQALTQAGWSQSPRLWLVTRGAVSVGTEPELVQVQQAPLWGLGRVIALEHPELRCVCLDLGQSSHTGNQEEIQALFKELGFSNREDQVAWRQAVRHVARLVRRPKQASESQCLVDHNSSYLITGGLGALGLTVAQWLVEQGAKHLMLTGRSGASATAQLAISQLEQAGAEVLVIKADVCHPEDVVRVLETIKTSLPPLRGIVHAAGVLDDGVLMQLSWERFHQVMAAKVEGAWNLHQLTQKLPLDFFVCFSSITSLLGNAGQGNYAAANAFLDALAHHRRALGLAGLTINWGPWADVGMAASLGSRDQSRMAAQGLGMIAPKQGLQILAQLLGQEATQVAVMPINWSKFLKQFPTDAYPALLSQLAERVQQPDLCEPMESMGTQSPDHLKHQLKQATSSERHQLLVAYLQNLVSQFLGLDPSQQTEPHQSLNELGLDSLVSIQLRNRIKTELQVDVPLGKFIGEASINQLANTLLEQLALASLLLSEAPSTDLSEDMEEITL